jgi:beta-galactosidase
MFTESAEAIAFYDSDFYKGKAAITKNTYGSGTVYYIGTVGEKALYFKLMKEILLKSQIPFVDGLPDNVEISTRASEGMAVRFIFNNTDKEQDFLIGDESIKMTAFEMKIDSINNFL